jgi:hypothetical protein
MLVLDHGVAVQVGRAFVENLPPRAFGDRHNLLARSFKHGGPVNFAARLEDKVPLFKSVTSEES